MNIIKRFFARSVKLLLDVYTFVLFVVIFIVWLIASKMGFKFRISSG